jgi:hypothetical protein
VGVLGLSADLAGLTGAALPPEVKTDGLSVLALLKRGVAPAIRRLAPLP